MVIGTDKTENSSFIFEIEMVWSAFYRDGELNTEQVSNNVRRLLLLFLYETSLIYLDTDVSKGPRFTISKILDV